MYRAKSIYFNETNSHLISDWLGTFPETNDEKFKIPFLNEVKGHFPNKNVIMFIK